MTQDRDISREEFATIAANASVRILAEDMDVMRLGYIGLQVMLSRLPRQMDYFDEPMLCFCKPGPT